jgi:hypothetical protein
MVAETRRGPGRALEASHTPVMCDTSDSPAGIREPRLWRGGWAARRLQKRSSMCTSLGITWLAFVLGDVLP